MYALIAATLLAACGLRVFVGSLHGPTGVERVEIAVAFPALALADHLGVFPDSAILFWLLGLGGFVLWFVVFYYLAAALVSRS